MSRRDTVSGPADPAEPVELGIEGLVDAVLVGRGGFGAVYRARQPRLNRVVAVKVLTAVLDPTALERFEREGFAMGTVAGHPNIVQVLGVGSTDGGRPYLLMPYVARGSLDRGLPLSWQVAVRHAVALCGALATAHAAGILHRDLKPANILVSEFGEPLIADFGIARTSTGFHTESGVITASLPYAPPEILDGGAASVAADVYSLAATVHCLISGRAPFGLRPGEAPIAGYLRIVRDPPPDLRRFGVPEQVCLVLEAAMAKDPAKRPGSAAGFGRLLQEAQRAVGEPVTDLRLATPDEVATVLAGPAGRTAPEQDPTAPAAQDPMVPEHLAQTRQVRVPTTLPEPEVPRSRRNGRLPWAIGVAGLLVVAVLGYLLWPSGPGGAADRAGAGGVGASSPGAAGEVTTPSGLALLPGGDLLVADSDRHRLIRVDRAGKVTVLAGTGTEGSTGDGGPAAQAELDYPAGIAATKDGEVYVTTGGGIRKIDASGVIAPVTGFPTNDQLSVLAIAGDGRLFVADGTTVLLRDTRGAVHTAISGGGLKSVNGLAVHPDGWLAVADTEGNQIMRVNDDGTLTRIVGLGGDTSGPVGDGLAGTQSQISGPAGLVFDGKGRLYFTETGNNRVRVLNTDGTIRTVAGNPEGYGEGDTGDGGPGRSATFRLGGGPLAAADDGTVYVGDAGNHRVRRIDPAGNAHRLV